MALALVVRSDGTIEESVSEGRAEENGRSCEFWRVLRMVKRMNGWGWLRSVAVERGKFFGGYLGGNMGKDGSGRESEAGR
jgi:hypothetical protein